MKRFWVLSFAYFLLLTPIFLRAQVIPDSALMDEIFRIKAIDNHAHPLKWVPEAGKPDDEFDALPLDAVEAFALPTRLDTGNPEFIGAWHLFYGYSKNDMSQAHIQELLHTKQQLLNQLGQGFPAWILDKLHIETMFANRVAMGPGLDSPRFRWVSFADALIFPLSNEAAKLSNPDYRGFFPGEERLLKRYLKDLHISELPATLDDYMKSVVTATLEKQKREGAVAVKFEAAYLRKLDFDEADLGKARIIYARYIRGGEPPPEDYKILQDFLFRFVAFEAGRLGMAVHIHCISAFGGYYRQSGSDPLLLESVFNDPKLRKTNFVVLHGAYPFSKEMGSLLSKPNVYTDFSCVTFVTYPRELSGILRNWLESYPGKVLFGTDAFSFGPVVDWGELAWLSNNSARQALAIALTGMIHDGEITRERAIGLAKMVLRENANRLYQFNMH